MRNTLEYKGYVGSIEFEPEEQCFKGRVLGLANTLLLYEGKSAKELIDDFRGAIDDYLIICEENRQKPEKPFKGSFNIRIGAERHKAVAMEAEQKGISMNALFNQILDERYSFA